jgi:transcription-repair coupling factor (superfamily II helicase)
MTTEDSEIDALEEEIRDRFGKLPPEAQNLLWLIRIKMLLKKFGIETLTVGPEKISFSPGKKSQINPTHAISLAASQPLLYQLTPDSRWIAKTPAHSLRDLFFSLEKLLEKLSQ